ncbi:MAG: M23 family metallopeptidase [Woeseia sp.]
MPSPRSLARLLAAVLTLAPLSLLGAQTLYKYQDDSGAWVFTDRVPPADTDAESQALPGATDAGRVTVSRRLDAGRLLLTAHNGTRTPVQFSLEIDALHNVALPAPEAPREWVIDAQDSIRILSVEASTGIAAPGVDYRYRWFPGDPKAEHRPDALYRAPYAVASGHPVTQAWPDTHTHTTRASQHAIDIAMPVGTDIHAARGGLVFEVESSEFRSGLDPGLGTANRVRILHDDGTFAIYAHLNRSSVRVRAGERVERGQYIADSGNTGYSSGPHLHFAVMRNAGFDMQSVPVQFASRDGAAVSARTGERLYAW